MFERDVERRLEQIPTGVQTGLALQAELIWIKTHLDQWILDWCPPDGDPRKNWHLLHDCLACQLLLTARIARKRSSAPDLAMYQRELLRVSIRMFTEALKMPGLTHMTHRASVMAFAAAIILKLSDRRDLVLRLALRLAGDPTRPAVPTWVGVTGKQMLSMLW